MTKQSSTRALALLGVLAAQAGCVGVVQPLPGVDGTASESVPGMPKPGLEGQASDSEEQAGKNDESEQSGIGTRVFALCDDAAERPGPRLLRLLTRREYQSTVATLLNARQPDVSSLPLEPRVRGFDNNARASVVTSRHVDEYTALSESLVAQAVREQKAALLPCQQTAADCPRTFVSTFGLRAFRRPLSADEVSRYSALFAPELTEGSFDEGMKLAMTSMLVSPSFLYRAEVGELQADGNYELTPYEVASALSYLYWGSMPDQVLFEAAARDQLRSKAELEQQARRLLADPRAEDQLGSFSLQWLRSDNVLGAFKDKQLYPAFTDSLRSAMVEEQQRFVSDVALTREGKFSELFRADYVFANDELARFYGLSPGGSEFAKLTVTPASQRGGLLGLGAVLAAHAHSNESSPIKRGAFVRDRLLCQDLPSPPENLDTTPPGLDPKLTTRERFAKHTADASCASCHQYIDGVGFGFEGFDGIGKLRTSENGLPVDVRGELRGPTALNDKTSLPFEGTRELSELLADSQVAESCLTLQYYRFARGYLESERDACSLSSLQQRFETKDLTIKELLVNVALLDSFTVRRAESK